MKRAFVALIPLLLLPNFLFMVPIAPAASSAQSSSPPPGQPLPPGTVTYMNTWNTTAPACPVTPTTQPLVPINSWSKTLRIPGLLFNYSPDPNGKFITQSFTLSSTGAFAVSDDHGNSFSFAVPISAVGASTATLVGNSTTALLETHVVAGLVNLADVKLAFSVYTQFCQPAGVRLEISGTRNWGPSGHGVVSIVFDKKPLSTPTYRAWFGNSSGVALGFDWSDSKALSPVYNSTLNAISWTVGNQFSIDPVTIGTTSQFYWTYDYEGQIEQASGRWWYFYHDGSNYGFRSCSTGTCSWSSETIITTSCTYGGYASVLPISYYVYGSTVYYACSSYAGTYQGYFRTGVLSSDGTITWSSELNLYSDTVVDMPSIAVSTTGTVWLSLEKKTGWQVWSCSSSCGTAANWAISTSDKYGSYGGPTQMVPLTSGKMAEVVLDCCVLEIKTWSGTSWSSLSQATGSYNLGQGSAVAIRDTVEVATAEGTNNGKVDYLYFPYGGAWSAATTVISGASTDMVYATISTDGSSNLIIGAVDNNAGTVRYVTSTNSGALWGPVLTLATSQTGAHNGIAPFAIYSGMTAMGWMSGSSSPYNVVFAAFPFTIPTAALSANSWSRSGLSPYESYFSHFSDYVSPGNGLVSVEAGTLDLSGRGLAFAPSLVYGEPYAFRSSGSPYLYDNYTGASVGYGWALNFPWLGTNYLHLSDGQAFPYSWNGNNFQYNGVTNFVLTKNTGGTYTLNMSSGTLYRFDTSKRLISITDRTGNNKITFGYGTNGYISQVTDTISRTITFSYNGNNQLTGIAQGGRTWTLGFVGSQLSTLTDPITARVTTFHYVGTSGANSWLIREVIWPTAGKVNYTYSSAPVGTEVSTYYATSRNVWYDSSHLSQSQSISPSLVNGQMVWSNSTIADGSRNIQSYLNYNFQNSKNLMKVYSYDGTKTLRRITETDSDVAGRTNMTKIISPTGTLLADSTYSYDNWGNMVFSKDNIGQKTWFSYVNTNSVNSFGNSSCTSSFYTPLSVSSNIHNLMVGRCDYQNGPGPQQQTYYKYDSGGNLLETKALHPSSGWLYTDYTYDSYGNVLTLKNPDGFYTNSTYSSTYSSAYLTKQNSTISRSPYKFAVTTWTWNSTLGEKASVTDPRGFSTSYKYDNIGRLKLITYVGTSYTWSYSYDDTNNIMTITDENGHVTKDYFDGLARQTKAERWNGSSVYSSEIYAYNWIDSVATKTTAAGSTYTYSYDWNGRLTKLTNPDSPATYETTSYDDVNNAKTFTDERGHQTVYAYDWNNRLTSVKQFNSSTNYYYATYVYDKSGNTLSVTDAHSPGQITSYQYDNLNRLNQTTFPDGKTETRTYDNLGNLLARTTANGSQISYSYDGLNRLTKVTYPGSGGTVTYTYDANGNRLSMLSPSATDYYSYSNDALSRLTNQTESVGGVKYQTLFSYDGVGNILTLTYPDGYALTMTYDGVNRLKKVGSYATVGYIVDDKINKISYGNGEVTTYTYDSRDRPTHILDKYGSTKEMDLNYTYDGTGNVKTLNTETYHYDWLNRLNYSSGPWTTITYAYDQAGNRIRMVQGSTTTYAYGSFNRLSSAGSTSYTYDANGNTITKTGGWTYSYDYENRLTKAAQSGTTKQQNSYDGDGNRVKQVAGSSTYTYSYQGLNILYEKNVTGGTTTVTKHFYANGLQVAKMVGSTVYYLHQDALGSTRLVATSTVTIKFSSNYVPYGSNYAISGKEVFMYTGKMDDSATGLYYMGARYYDIVTGRFITQDSYQGNWNDPMSLNRYIYARDNPERYVDTNGHMFAIDENSGIDPLTSALATSRSPIISTIVTTTITTASTTTVTVSSPTGTTTTTTTTTATTTSTTVTTNDISVTTTSTVIVTKTVTESVTISRVGSTASCYGIIGAGALGVPLGAGGLELAGVFGLELAGTAAVVGILTLGVGIPIVLLVAGLYITYYNVKC